MTKTNTWFVALTLILAVVISSTWSIYQAFGVSNVQDTPASESRFRDYQFFTRTWNQSINFATSSLTSSAITGYADSEGRFVDGTLDLRGAKNVNFIFARGDTTGQGNTGSSLFTVQVSNDGSNWLAYNDLVAVAATTTANITHQGSATLTGTSSIIMKMDSHGFAKARCIVAETTDGEHTCEASVSY